MKQFIIPILVLLGFLMLMKKEQFVNYIFNDFQPYVGPPLSYDNTPWFPNRDSMWYPNGFEDMSWFPKEFSKVLQKGDYWK